MFVVLVALCALAYRLYVTVTRSTQDPAEVNLGSAKEPFDTTDNLVLPTSSCNNDGVHDYWMHPCGKTATTTSDDHKKQECVFDKSVVKTMGTDATSEITRSVQNIYEYGTKHGKSYAAQPPGATSGNRVCNPSKIGTHGLIALQYPKDCGCDYTFPSRLHCNKQLVVQAAKLKSSCDNFNTDFKTQVETLETTLKNKYKQIEDKKKQIDAKAQEVSQTAQNTSTLSNTIVSKTALQAATHSNNLKSLLAMRNKCRDITT